MPAGRAVPSQPDRRREPASHASARHPPDHRRPSCRRGVPAHGFDHFLFATMPLPGAPPAAAAAVLGAPADGAARAAAVVRGAVRPDRGRDRADRADRRGQPARQRGLLPDADPERLRRDPDRHRRRRDPRTRARPRRPCFGHADLAGTPLSALVARRPPRTSCGACWPRSAHGQRRRTASTSTVACADGRLLQVECAARDLRDDPTVRGLVLTIARRHRAAPPRGRPVPPGVPRRADRAGQPGAVPQPARAGLRRSPSATAPRSPCSSSTSTTSRRSTTPSGTRSATSCWSPSAADRRDRRRRRHRRPDGRRRVRHPDRAGPTAGAAEEVAAADRRRARRAGRGQRRPRRHAHRQRRGQRRRRHQPRRGQRHRAAAPRRPGPLPGQGRRQGHLAAVPQRAARGDGRAAGDAGRAARGDRRRASSALQYQPIVDLHTGQIAGVESLVRWQHPTRGPARPVPLHRAGRGERRDRRDRQLGAARGAAPSSPAGRPPTRTPRCATSASTCRPGSSARPASSTRCARRSPTPAPGPSGCCWRSPRAWCCATPTRSGPTCGRCGRWASGSRSTTSAPATRR